LRNLGPGRLPGFNYDLWGIGRAQPVAITSVEIIQSPQTVDDRSHADGIRTEGGLEPKIGD